MGIRKMSQWRRGPCTSLHLPTPPPPLPRKVLSIFFALPSMNCPLPAELKFRENPVQAICFIFPRIKLSYLCHSWFLVFWPPLESKSRVIKCHRPKFSFSVVFFGISVLLICLGSSGKADFFFCWSRHNTAESFTLCFCCFKWWSANWFLRASTFFPEFFRFKISKLPTRTSGRLSAITSWYHLHRVLTELMIILCLKHSS